MSENQVNKADGCSVFFSVIIVAVLAVLIVGLYNLFRPEDPIAATSAIDKQRAGKIGDHRIDNSNYLDKVDTFHAEKNSSLQTVMEKVAESYRSNSNSNK
tara:strand:+ start:5309 stop:5608 length:300 start_codon:yes stop_codon:yes gene_type:complete